MIKRIQAFVYGFMAFHVVWWLLAVCVDSRVLVSPVVVYKNIGIILHAGMLQHIWASTLRIIEGVCISLILGVFTGLLLAGNKKINKVFSPVLYFTYPIPKLALLPVVVLLLGIGEVAKVAMIVLILMFQIIVATRDAVFNISKEDFHVLTSLGAKKREFFRWIIFPAILPEVLTSLRIAVGTAISVLFFTETFGTDKGMGFYIVDSWMRLSYIEMYAGILVLSMMGFILFLLIDILERYLCLWKKKI